MLECWDDEIMGLGNLGIFEFPIRNPSIRNFSIPLFQYSSIPSQKASVFLILFRDDVEKLFLG
jgi:hypothetical protein